ncbi:hypothetical protein AM587_10007749 [Phytophthora nicotianae]|uniref:RxLR effector protein n=5 Tax=Phytophthora nicotianae TaxID=4792 RepID=A0A0W8BYF7_PHYNI|nr:hypothetical protein AM587_10007749 [Phytophthora nicotianae]
MLVVLLASTAAGSSKFSSTLQSPEIRASAHPIMFPEERSLRSETTLNENSEERGNMFKTMWKYVKVQLWLETKMSKEYVKTALKLDGLDDADIKTHKNYKYYSYFADKSEEYRLIGWLQKDYTTFDAWHKELNLNRITQANELNKVEATDAFRVYKHYVNMHDTLIVRQMNIGNAPEVVVSRGATAAEMTARTIIMAKAERSDKAAQRLLGLIDPHNSRVLLTGEALTRHVDYQYFKLFRKLKKEFTSLNLQTMKKYSNY